MHTGPQADSGGGFSEAAPGSVVNTMAKPGSDTPPSWVHLGLLESPRPSCPHRILESSSLPNLGRRFVFEAAKKQNTLSGTYINSPLVPKDDFMAFLIRAVQKSQAQRQTVP